MLSDILNELDVALAKVDAAKQARDKTVEKKATAIARADRVLATATAAHRTELAQIEAASGVEITAAEAAYQQIAEHAQGLSDQATARMATIMPDSFRGRSRVS